MDDHCTCKRNLNGLEKAKLIADDYYWAEHTCPFAVEIYENSKTCTCCPYCTNECAMDI